MDLQSPHRLQVDYTRAMFASLLIKPLQRSSLIVGLGGGAMVQFLNHYFPDMTVDAVEIDPVVVQVASDYFGTRAGPRTRIITEDAFDYLKQTTSRYDVIYMDAFLSPTEATDLTGAPRRLKTATFLKSLHERLQQDGLVVFNLNGNTETEDDIRSIRAAFPWVYVFAVPGTANVVVVGSLAHEGVAPVQLRMRGAALDREHDFGFSFRALAEQLANH